MIGSLLESPPWFSRMTVSSWQHQLGEPTHIHSNVQARMGASVLTVRGGSEHSVCSTKGASTVSTNSGAAVWEGGGRGRGESPFLLLTHLFLYHLKHFTLDSILNALQGSGILKSKVKVEWNCVETGDEMTCLLAAPGAQDGKPHLPRSHLQQRELHDLRANSAFMLPTCGNSRSHIAYTRIIPSTA